MLQEKFDLAMDNYLDMSRIVRSDLYWILDMDDNIDHWRRTFLRSSIPLIEAYCQSFRDMVEVAIDAGIEVSNKNRKAVMDEKSCDAKERIKRNIRTAYEVFELSPAPDFGCMQWENAKDAIDKRGALMPPISHQDLDVSEDSYYQYQDRIVWLYEAVFGIVEKLVIKYGGRAGK